MSATEVTTRSEIEALVRAIFREEIAQRDGTSSPEIMNAEDVAAYLRVDRNTVYDYAGRGVIPCQRLGKRLLFHRAALVTWLVPCKAAVTRKD